MIKVSTHKRVKKKTQIWLNSSDLLIKASCKSKCLSDFTTESIPLILERALCALIDIFWVSSDIRGDQRENIKAQVEHGAGP